MLRASNGIGRAVLLAALALSASGGANAQAAPSAVVGTDYYKAGASADTATALRNVEIHHIDVGIAQMKRKNFAGALGDFEFILNYFPNHPRALALLSDLCDLNWKSNQCDPTAHFERAIKINPEASQTHLVHGLHLHRIGKLPDSVTAYQRALQLNPASRNAHYNVGLAYFDLKDFNLANLHAQAAYALGFTLPGLRDKLTKAGRWKPLPEDEVRRVTSLDAAKVN